MNEQEEDLDLNLEEFYITLDRIKSKAEIICTTLNGLQFPYKWQVLVGQFSALTKQYRILNEEFMGLTEECRFVYPHSLEGLQNPHVIPEILRTRMEPEFENDSRNLAEEWKKRYGENQISISEVEEQIYAYERMCGNLLDMLMGAVESQKLARQDIQPIRPTDTKALLSRLLSSVEKGTELILPVKIESPTTVLPSNIGHFAAAGPPGRAYASAGSRQVQMQSEKITGEYAAPPNLSQMHFTSGTTPPINQAMQFNRGAFADVPTGQTITNAECMSQLPSAAAGNGFSEQMVAYKNLPQATVALRRGLHSINQAAQQYSHPISSHAANVVQAPLSSSSAMPYFSYSTMPSSVQSAPPRTNHQNDAF